MINSRTRALVWVGVAALITGCAHKPAAPGSAANPIAPVSLPKVSPEAQAAFDDGVRVMKMGRRHYKEARKPLEKAVQVDPRLYEAWHDLGVIETALGNFEVANDDFKRAHDIQPGARKTVLAYGESLRRAHRPKSPRKSTPAGSAPTPTTSRCAPATGRS